MIDETRQVTVHIVMFLVMMFGYAMDFISPERYAAAMQTYTAIMAGAIYFKTKRK